jgi:hypothetical protein
MLFGGKHIKSRMFRGFDPSCNDLFGKGDQTTEPFFLSWVRPHFAIESRRLFVVRDMHSRHFSVLPHGFPAVFNDSVLPQMK